MISYFLNRWAFAKHFEKAGDGYVYHRRPDLPGITLTDDERRDCLREYRRRYWKTTAVGFAAAMAGVLVIVGLSLATEPDRRDALLQVSSYVLAAAVAIYFVLEFRKLAMIPEKRFGDRPRVAAVVPTGNWLQRFEMAARRRSWLTHATLLAIYGFITWLLVPRNLSVSTGHWAAFGLFAICLLALIAGVWMKAKGRRQP